MIGQPKAIIHAIHGQIIFLKQAVERAKHDDVLMIEAVSYNQLRHMVDVLKVGYQYSHKLTCEHFKSGGKLWAYLLVQYKNVA